MSDQIQVTVIATGLNKTTTSINIDSPRYANDEIVAPRFKPENTPPMNPNTSNLEKKDTLDNDIDSIDSQTNVRDTSLGNDLDIPTFMRNRNMS